MANEHRWSEQDRYRGFGGERSRYEGLGSQGEYGDEPRGDMGPYGREAGRMGRYEQGSHGQRSGGPEQYGQHRGRGPRGYQRSDERIREDVSDRLTDDPLVDASDIEVSVGNREVTMNGTVSSREEKRRAEDIAESVSGVSHVQNNLRVKQAAAGESGSGAVGDATTYPKGTVGTGNLARQ